MRQIIYADTVFLLNFCMDFLALFAAGKILGLKLKIIRLVTASVFGAVYCVFTLLFDESVIPVIILNIAVSVIMCLIAFKTDTLVNFVKAFAIFYAACFMLGGGIEALYHLSGFVKTDGGNNAPPIQVIIILAGICSIIFIFTGRLFKRNAKIKEVDLTIGYGGREIKVEAILDTGNLLRDPVSSLPVIIIRLNTAANLFDLKTLEFFAGDTPSYISKISTDTEQEKVRIIKKLKFKLIPVKSVAGANNILPAFVPDYIKYIKNKNLIEINAVVAVDSSTSQKYGGNYSGIIPAELID